MRPPLDALLDALLRNPPANHRGLAMHPLKDLRRAAADRILRGQLTEAQTDALPLLFRLLGPGDQRSALQSLLLNPRAPNTKRTMALAALFHDPQSKALIDGLSPPVRIALDDPWLRPLVRLAQHELEASEAVADALSATLPPWRAQRLAQIERLRVQLGVAAPPLYRRALNRVSLVHHWPQIRALLVAAQREDRAEPLPKNLVALFGKSPLQPHEIIAQ